jgi:prepilin-type N-terminal cleavage/methylation domain-containing protein
MTRQPANSARSGFTLIELLVVMSIIVVLATLAILVGPRFGDSQKSALGASQLQGWLAVAKQRAYRDKIVSGVQLLPDPTSPNLVTTLQYVEQPDDYRGGANQGGYLTAPGSGGLSTVRIQGINPTGAVQPGDFLEITALNENTAHLILGGPTSVGGNVWELTLASKVTSAVNGETRWRIVRQPRASSDEPVLKMPADMCIDLGAPSINGQTSPLTVLFSPWGGVQQTTGSTAGKYIYWVRDKTKDTPYDGEPTLIVVYCRTGAIAAHPVNLTGDPFSFTKDGRSSGM